MKLSVKALVLCAMAVVVNVVLGEAVSAIKIPLLFLDTMGTIFIAAVYGMPYGILTGIATNFLMGVIGGWVAFPFALVSVAVAIVVALVARKNFTLTRALIAGVILSIVAPMIGAPIRIALFGGLTGSGTDVIILALRQAGQEMISATYWGAVTSNIVDKIVSCVLVAVLLMNKQIKSML